MSGSERAGLRRLGAQFTGREAHPSIQFIKYGIAGGLATFTHVAAFFTLSLWVFPAMLADTGLDALLVDWLGLDLPAVAESLRRRNFFINNALAFLLSNLVAYLINFHWVFHPGRHRRHVEIALFLLVSAGSLLVGIQIGLALMRWFEATTTLSQICNIAASVMINFVCRKYLVFKG
jgi:putative flippase GtrA